MKMEDFINLLAIENNIERAFWLNEVKDNNGEKEWKDFCNSPLSPEMVIILARAISTAIGYELESISQTEFYAEIQKEGHNFLKEIHLKSVEQGVKIELKEIDRPITLSEILAAMGHIIIENNMVRLSPEGERIAEEVKEEIERHPTGGHGL